jgi:glyoxylase-like metal-dependent hydrolase (beta-lactamase superfamily II)
MPTPIPFNRALEFTYGEPARLTPLIRRVIAENPSAFTFHGTGTYIIGADAPGAAVAVIDPGPDDDDHVAALLRAVAGQRVSHILITHTHRDHSPAAAALKAATGAPTLGYGPHARYDGEGVEAGGDLDFVPDRVLGDGAVVAGEGWTFEAVHTPGHTSNHLCFALREENALFCGDHVMGWSTTIVSPPDGDMHDYMNSLAKLRAHGETRYYPTHGAPIDAPHTFLDALIAHRQEREAQIAACLADGVGRIPDMVKRMYADVDAKLHPAAARSVLAHLEHMVATGRAACEGVPQAGSVYRAA